MIEAILLRVLSAAIAYHTIVCLNAMTPATAHSVRLAYVAQAGGAIGAMFGIEYALPLMLAGVAARPCVDRRRPLYG